MWRVPPAGSRARLCYLIVEQEIAQLQCIALAHAEAMDAALRFAAPEPRAPPRATGGNAAPPLDGAIHRADLRVPGRRWMQAQ
eukprot:2124761-Prymnesium_polylepis.1